MSDDEPDVTPEQEAQVRRLLAEARHDEPVPVDVAARLDRVLRQLAAESPDTWTGADVVDLAARRRRRVVGLLVAAAAVVVVGVGVNQVVGTRDGGADSGAGAAAEDSSEGGQARSNADSPPLLAEPSAGDQPTTRGKPVRPVLVGSKSFAADVLRYQDRHGVPADAESLAGPGVLTNAPAFVCEPADWGPGTLLAAYYDGTPAVLAYRPRTGDTQVVDLLQCGSGDLLRSTVVQMP